MSEVKKKKKFVAKCVYSQKKWCYQTNSYAIREWKKPNEEECAACLSAYTCFGMASLRRPLEEDEARTLRNS
jgi:hypothetical protein